MADPIKVTATINGKPVDVFVNSLDRFGEVAARAVDRAMQAYLENISGKVRRSTYRAAGLVSRSGDLLRSVGSRGAKGIFGVTTRATGKGFEVTGEIGSRLIYAWVQEHGMTIRAKRAPWLLFPILAPGGGLKVTGWARAKVVTIPARPFLEPAIEQSKAAGALLFREAYQKAMTEVT